MMIKTFVVVAGAGGATFFLSRRLFARIVGAVRASQNDLAMKLVATVDKLSAGQREMLFHAAVLAASAGAAYLGYTFVK